MLRIKKILAFALLGAMAVFLIGCGQNAPTPAPTPSPQAQKENEDLTPVKAEIEMKNGDKITLELYPQYAPITVQNFVELAESGFYEGLTFHRIIKGFMIQGGDPSGDGTGGPGYTIKGEFKQNGVDNPLKHERGVISMARAGDPNSAGSQFFIMHETKTHLDGAYAAFGRVIDGMDVVDALANTPVRPDGETPIEKPVIKAVRIIK